MEVILLKQCKQGKVGDIVNVKSGFARNFLIPNSIAQRATEANKADVAQKLHELQLINQELLNAAEVIRAKLGDASLTIVREVSNDMKLYAAVSRKDIASAIQSKYNVIIDPEAITMAKRIKELGIFNDINLKLHHNVVVNIILTVQQHTTAH